MHTFEESITGTITSIDNHGTIVLVVVEREEGREATISFDHSPFRSMLEGEGVEPDELIGREVAYEREVLRLC